MNADYTDYSEAQPEAYQDTMMPAQMQQHDQFPPRGAEESSKVRDSRVSQVAAINSRRRKRERLTIINSYRTSTSRNKNKKGVL